MQHVHEYARVLLAALAIASAVPGLATAQDAPGAAEPALFPVQVGDQWGYMDETGAMVIPPQYDEAEFFSDGLAQVMTGESVAFIDQSGEAVLETTELWIWSFSEGLAVARPRDTELWGYVDRTGAFVIEPQFEEAYSFSEGLAAVSTGDRTRAGPDDYGYIDRSGEFVIRPQFWGARRFSGGLAPVMVEGFVDGKWGFIDRSGSFVIDPVYDEEALPFSGGLAAVAMDAFGDDRWGYIDENGDIVVELEYTLARPFAGGLGVVRDDSDRWLYINADGEQAIEGEYEVAEPFHGPLARVADEGSVGYGHQGGTFYFMAGNLDWRYIDRQGRQVWPKPPPERTASEAGAPTTDEGVALTDEELREILPQSLIGLSLTSLEPTDEMGGGFTAIYSGEERELQARIARVPEMMRRMMEREMGGAAEGGGIQQSTFQGFTMFMGPLGDGYQAVVFADGLLAGIRGEFPADRIREALRGLNWEVITSRSAQAHGDRDAPESLNALLPESMPGGYRLTDVDGESEIPGSIEARYTGDSGELLLLVAPLTGFRGASIRREVIGAAEASEDLERGTFRGLVMVEGLLQGEYRVMILTEDLLVVMRGEAAAEQVHAALGSLDWERIEAAVPPS